MSETRIYSNHSSATYQMFPILTEAIGATILKKNNMFSKVLLQQHQAMHKIYNMLQLHFTLFSLIYDFVIKERNVAATQRQKQVGCSGCITALINNMSLICTPPPIYSIYNYPYLNYIRIVNQQYVQSTYTYIGNTCHLISMNNILSVYFILLLYNA